MKIIKPLFITTLFAPAVAFSHCSCFDEGLLLTGFNTLKDAKCEVNIYRDSFSNKKTQLMETKIYMEKDNPSMYMDNSYKAKVTVYAKTEDQFLRTYKYYDAKCKLKNVNYINKSTNLAPPEEAYNYCAKDIKKACLKLNIPIKYNKYDYLP